MIQIKQRLSECGPSNLVVLELVNEFQNKTEPIVWYASLCATYMTDPLALVPEPWGYP